MASHRKVIDDVFDRFGSIDLVYVPAGILGSQEAFDADPTFAAKAVEINRRPGVGLSGRGRPPGEAGLAPSC